MKVILTQDVARIGKRFEVVNVPDGHALNLLIPKGQAQPATPENIKRLEQRKTHVASAKSAAADSFAHTIEQMTGNSYTMEVEANENGGLFQAVKSEQIAAFFTEQGMTISAEQVKLDEPIKQVGEHQVELSDGATAAVVTITVAKK